MTLGLTAGEAIAGEALPAPARRQGLPIEITGFVGRHAELAALTSLLRTARLITVTGPGGVGKTRLTVHVASQLAERYADGVCLVELSGLRDPELLPDTIAEGLGLSETGNRLDLVTEYLRDRELLLILDTCEHLVDACAMFADLALRATTGLTLLATSRQPLDVPGEHAFPVPPLGDADSVTLFAQRAATVVPGFVVDDQNRDTVAALCKRLDGVPLALELATVRLRALPLDQLAARLEDRFRLLAGGRRAALPHHQTLRAATEWSYDLCVPAEQLLWTRLAVFAGTFDIAAAESVGAGPDLPRQDILPMLIGLVDKSVVLRAGDGYRLLDTIREFGAERLAGEAEIRARHVARYVAMAEDFEANLARGQLARYRALRDQHANTRAAIEHALALGLDAQAARLVTALYPYWHIAGLPREGRYWVNKVLERFTEPGAERAALLITRCGLVIKAADDGKEGIAIAQRLGDHRLAAHGYLHLHLALAGTGAMAEAAQAGAEAERRLTELGDTVGLHILDAQLSQMHALAGQPELAIAQCRRGLRRHEPGDADGEVWITSYLHYTIGLALFQQGEDAQAAAAAREALAMKAELGDQMGMAHCLEVLAWAAARQGRAERAAWLLGAADTLWQRTGRRLSGNAFLEQYHQAAVRAIGAALGAERAQMLHERGGQAPAAAAVSYAAHDADSLPPAGPSTMASPALPAGPGDLTSREAEIAALIAAGLSNRDIANRLVISRRTVEAHVEHIYAKLGISSRVQLATWLTSAQ